jgi:hypothetical protein
MNPELMYDSETPEELVGVLKSEAFTEGLQRYVDALRANAGDWPEFTVVARTVAAATGAWDGTGGWSQNEWEAGLRQEFPDYFASPEN